MDNSIEPLRMIIKLTPEQRQQKRMESLWYFFRIEMDFINWYSVKWSSIQEKLWLRNMIYILFFIASLAVLGVNLYLLIENAKEMKWYENLYVCGYLFFTILWIVLYFKEFLMRCKTVDLVDEKYFVIYTAAFTFTYILFGIASIESLFPYLSVGYKIAIILLYIAYGTFTTVCHTFLLVVIYGICVIGLGELIIRAITCSLKDPCPNSPNDEIMKEFPVKLYNDNDFLQKNCSICLQDFEIGKEVCQLPCHFTHVFHKQCLKELLDSERYSCPMCSTPFFQI